MLTIPRYCFSSVFDPEGRQSADDQLEGAWRLLLLNKRGHLAYFGDDEIVITDDPPKEKRPATLLRWTAQSEKDEAERWAERLGMSLNEYIVSAVMDHYREQATED